MHFKHHAPSHRPLAIATRWAVRAHLLLFTKHGNTVTSVRLSRVCHLSTDTMRRMLRGIPAKLNGSRKTVGIYQNKQLVLLLSEALGGVTRSEEPTASFFRKNVDFLHNLKCLKRQMSSQTPRRQNSRS